MPEPELTDLARAPALTDEVDRLIAGNMPPFMTWESPGNWRWGLMYELFPSLQLCLLDGGRLVAAANGVPVRWDGTAAALPGGADDVLVHAVDRGPADRGPGAAVDAGCDAVCMVSVSVRPEHRAAGHAERLLSAVRGHTARTCPRGVIVPVRPTRKHHYPLIPMAAYAAWRRADGTCFDPWLRTHLDLGARPLGIAERSLVVRAPAARWEQVLGRPMPGPGDHLVPGALAPVRMSGDGVGTYVEPNVWVHHT